MIEITLKVSLAVACHLAPSGPRGLPAYSGELNQRCATIAEVLREQGYHTGMVGKWHLSHVTIAGSPDAKEVMNSRWKIVGPAGEPWKLFDLSQNRTELHDLSDSQPIVKADLIRAWEAWAHRVGALPRP